MCDCTKNSVDLDQFYWKEDLPIISEHFTFRQLLSEPLIKLINRPEILDKPITNFQYVPCTRVYALSDSDEIIDILISLNTNKIEEINILGSTWQQYLFNSSRFTIQGYPEKRNIVFDKDEYSELEQVRQDLLDSIRIKCPNNQIANKDGLKIELL